MRNGFLRIPRALFLSEAWRKATHEQRSVFIDLCFRVAYKDHERVVNGCKVLLNAGQCIAIQEDMARQWGMTRQQVRTLIKTLSNLNLISTKVITKGFTKFTVLTVNVLYNYADQGETDVCSQHLKEEKNKNKGDAPQKDPQRGVSLSENSVKSSKGNITLTKQIENARNELADKWREFVRDGQDKSALALLHFLPYNAAVICNDPNFLKYIHSSPQIPRVDNGELNHKEDFFRFHLLDFVYRSGLRTKMHVDALFHLADTLMQRSRYLNMAQVTLFFYLLGNSDGRVGNVDWKGWFESDKVTKAFGCYLEWISKIER